MSNIITVKNLSKIYSIYHEEARYKSLRDDLVSFAKNPFSAFSEKKEKFYALKDISFSVKQGETLGIIGPNGAGKSTLLKILSRITPPSKGEIQLKGRVSSLLEVGTGFHPELTGRENIFLSGAVLGMKQYEIKRKFDEIIDFAGVEKFLDTPVKHYSSGMYTRLAFSVAAHLEPEILIVDEVLAVGDAAFQKKCLGKMSEVGKEGRTIIFVSHNMAAISQLCKNSIFINKGKIVKIGASQKIISEYLSWEKNSQIGSVDFTSQSRKNSLEDSRVLFKNISIRNSKNKITNTINAEEPFSVELEIGIKENVSDFFLGLSILNISSRPIYSTQITKKEISLKRNTNSVRLTLSLNPNIFGPGVYTVGLGASGEKVLDFIPEALSFTIQETQKESLKGIYEGLVIYPRKWKIKLL